MGDGVTEYNRPPEEKGMMGGPEAIGHRWGWISPRTLVRQMEALEHHARKLHEDALAKLKSAQHMVKLAEEGAPWEQDESE